MVTNQGYSGGGIDSWMTHDVDLTPGEEGVLYPSTLLPWSYDNHYRLIRFDCYKVKKEYYIYPLLSLVADFGTAYHHLDDNEFVIQVSYLHCNQRLFLFLNLSQLRRVLSNREIPFQALELSSSRHVLF